MCTVETKECLSVFEYEFDDVEINEMVKQVQDKFTHVNTTISYHPSEDECLTIYHDSRDEEFIEFVNDILYEKFYSNDIFNICLIYNPKKVIVGV